MLLDNSMLTNTITNNLNNDILILIYIVITKELEDWSIRIFNKSFRPINNIY